jgi:FMN phosphatase YigB (HAD superfamily)
MKNIIIFDLDGTLALIDHRKHFVEERIAYADWYQGLTQEERSSNEIIHNPFFYFRKTKLYIKICMNSPLTN